MYTVYLIRSKKFPKEKYVGFTEDLRARITSHNNGQSIHTAKFKPWDLVVSVDFTDKKKALLFESYLKSGSGRAFALRHFWN